jgi:hypothetical protein
MSDDGDDIERARAGDTPRDRETIRETERVVVRSSNAGWWIAAFVAVLAVIGLFIAFGGQNREDEVQAAREQGAAQAQLDAATADAQRSAQQASLAAQSAAASAGDATQRAEQSVPAPVDQGAPSAGQAAQDTGSTEPAAPAYQSPPPQ